jgi:hypothetical protein
MDTTRAVAGPMAARRRRTGSARAATATGLAGLLLGLLGGAAVTAAAGASASSQLTQAKQQLLVKSDLPSGWTAQGSVTTSGGGGKTSFPGGNQLATCIGVSPRLITLNTPEATSPTFQTAGSVDSVQDQVSVFSSAKVGAQQYTAISGPKVPGCLTEVLAGPAGQQLTQSFGSGVTVGTISVTPAKRAMLIPHSSGFTMAFPVTTKGISLTATVTVISFVRGTFGTQVTLTTAGLPFPAALAHHLVAVASSRG